ncbi:ATP synthase subunit b, mitochondrial [Eumeta japonica]|uniref:ATP synthase subunit b n=1 Tax=Eumeta variegata TaxID=151549 RepID=A0A4C2AAG5_EUMVA|nr:ATP synthase subunit b, mitochondrial [Eumeta japonica]
MLPYLSIPKENILSRITHTNTCPVAKTQPKSSAAKPPATPALVRQERSGKCRLGFLPEEWFLFVHPFTGVSGPYILMIALANYGFSKEIIVCEHEYYGGLTWIVLIYLVTTRAGPKIGEILDQKVDAHENEFKKSRTEEEAIYLKTIENEKEAQMQAQGQELLMQAKKENIAMQLEAAYRERLMTVYNTVKGRMDYHVKLYAAESRIQQKYMIDWILDEVKEAITPEFQEQVMERYIQDLGALASKA